MKQRITLLLTILLVGVAAIAQQPQQRKGPEEFKKEYQQFIAKQAKLTAEEAAAFFPIYNECQEKKNKLNGQIWKLRRDTYNKELTEKDYQRILEEIAKLRIQIEELDKELVILQIKSVDLYFTKYLGSHELVLNGLPIKSNKIYLFANGR